MTTQASKISVMIADDHPVVRAGLTAIIDAQDDMAVVAEAGDGREAAERFREHRPDVTLMDLVMPVMSGIEAVKAILEEYPPARIIVLTTYDGDTDIHRAIEAGVRGYLLKGMFGDDLLDAIRTVGAGRRSIPPQIREHLAAHAARSELTSRETQVLELIVRGNSNREIASELGITERTVKWFVNIILSKLRVRDRTQAATAAMQRGIVRLP